MISNSRYLTVSALFVLFLVICMTLNPGIYSIPEDIGPDIIIAIPGKDKPGVSFDPLEIRGDRTFFALVTSNSTQAASAGSVNALHTLEYINYPYIEFASVQDCINSGIYFQTMIITVPDISGGDVSLLTRFMEKGGNVVFTQMPGNGTGLSAEMKKMLGIADIRAGYTIEGFHIYDDILLGGMFTAQEWSFVCSKVVLTGTGKVFANGHNPDRDKNAPSIAREDENPIIWRNSYGNGMVFVINAPFMEQCGGIGILTGILSILNDDFIYPVIGAKTVILENYPYISEPENYINNRSVFAFQRDIVSPNLISIAVESGIVYTCFTNGDFNKNYDSATILESFASDLHKSLKSDIGYTVNSIPEILDRDLTFLNNNFTLYNIRSFFLPDNMNIDSINMEKFTNMTSLLLPKHDDNAFTWLSEKAITLPILTRGVNSEEENLNFTGMISALGLSIHSVDISKAIAGQPVEINWSEYSIEIAKYFSYLYKNTGFIPSYTLPYTAEAVKDYLNTDYEFRKTENKIYVSMKNNIKEISFILKTDKTIGETVNCTVRKIENGAYLVKSNGSLFEIELKENLNPYK